LLCLLMNMSLISLLVIFFFCLLEVPPPLFIDCWPGVL
jgi:hypothetical protein